MWEMFQSTSTKWLYRQGNCMIKLNLPSTYFLLVGLPYWTQAFNILSESEATVHSAYFKSTAVLS